MTRALTDEELDALNRIRRRKNRDAISREEIEAWFPYWSDAEFRALLDVIESDMRGGLRA